jgi:hypothetical protein
MADDAPGPSPLPEHPDLRDIAVDAIAYSTLGELAGVSDKAIRDAGTIPVTPI